MKIEFRRDKFYQPIPGRSSHVFHSYLYVDGKRVGTVWKDKGDGRYVANEDFDTCRHDRANRPRQAVARTLGELRRIITTWH